MIIGKIDFPDKLVRGMSFEEFLLSYGTALRVYSMDAKVTYNKLNGGKDIKKLKKEKKDENKKRD